LELDTLTFIGGTGLTSAITNNVVTFDIDSSVVTLTDTQTLTNKTITGTFTGNLTGNASTASAWATPRTISLGGDLTGSVSIDGSSNVTLTASITNGPAISQNTYQASGTSEQVFDTFDKTLYRSAHYHVNITSFFNGIVIHQTSQLSIIHNGTTANIFQYGDIYLDEEIAEYNVQINGNDVEVTVTPNGTDAQINYVRQLINNTGFTPTFGGFGIDLQTENIGTIDLSTSNLGTFDLNAA